ncbi:MAG: PAS domain S-box protein, partial [Thermodesulfobacteriota bacterium]
VLENAVDAMSSNIDRADAIGIYMVEGEEAIIKAHKGFNDRYIEQAGIIPYPKGFTWKTIIEGKPRYVSDVYEDASIGPAGREAGIKSYLSMPIRFEEKSVGCVNINSLEKNAFDEEELKLLQIVIQQIESAINNAQVAEQLRLKSVIVGNMAEGIGLARTSDNIIVYVNPTFEKMFGYNPDELIGKSALILSPFGDNAREQPEIIKINECVNQNGIWSGELLNIKKDGTSFWSLASVSTFDHPQHGKLWVGIHTDITERKQAEEQLKTSHEQLRNLAAHLQSVREEERTTISREIHDELAQVLTGLKMSLSWVDKKLSDAGDNEVSRSQMLEEIEAMSKLVDNAVQTVQEISAELRPVVLDDLGLTAAIEWQAQEFQTRMGIRCRFTSSLENITLDKERSTAIFRILQETLTNVARHANATRVNISLKEKAGNLVLEVRDNGEGISKNAISNPKSLGLIGIRERAILLGGKVKISGSPGKGTTITVQIPL